MISAQRRENLQELRASHLGNLQDKTGLKESKNRFGFLQN